jgi:uncharacterized membrane protein
MVFRHLDGTADYAAKSLFTVFRVPLIEVICGLAIALMRRRATGVSEAQGYYFMWTILLWTVAAKTFFQMLDMLSPGHRAEQFFYVTGIVVIIGIILAGVAGRKAFAGFKRREWKLERWEIATLVGLLAGYLILAFLPL